jgi:hypothetical protein
LSLLDKKSTGGAVARAGFEYQDAYVLQSLPSWIAQTAFSHVVSEAKGDIEVCYFSPAVEFTRDTYQAKDYALTESQFWSEVRAFKQLHDDSPAEFVWFGLVCPRFNKSVAPLINKLFRLRGVGTAYPRGSPIALSTRGEIISWIEQRVENELAEFIVDRVEFVEFAAANADNAFSGELAHHLPCLELALGEANRLRDKIKNQIKSSATRPVLRQEIEAAIAAHAPPDGEWEGRTTTIRLIDGPRDRRRLDLDISGFVDNDRICRTSKDWALLASAIDHVAAFVKQSGQSRRIALEAKQRTSMSCLLGFSFSSVRGFVLHAVHNGSTYLTNYAKTKHVFFHVSESPAQCDDVEGVATIGFPIPIEHEDLATALERRLARIELRSQDVITNAAVLSACVAEAKSHLATFRSKRQLRVIHLFIKAPSIFALTLGARLNGLGRIQLYDWIDGRYIPTAVINA